MSITCQQIKAEVKEMYRKLMGQESPSISPVQRAELFSQAWKEVLAMHAEERSQFELSEFNRVWKLLKLSARALNRSPDRKGRGGILLRDAARILVDFNTGPATFLQSGKNFRDGKGHDSKEIRAESIPGLQLRERDFLTGPRDLPDKYADKLAAEFADGPERTGVWVLGGVRGSGKSTFLNKIEWFCNNWVRGQRRPVVLRLDLGGGFNRDKFNWNLLQSLCREVRAHCRRSPHAEDFSLPAVAAAEFGSWCETNRPWAITLIAIILFTVTAVELMKPVPEDVVLVTTNAVAMVGAHFKATNSADSASASNTTNGTQPHGTSNASHVATVTNGSGRNGTTNALAALATDQLRQALPDDLELPVTRVILEQERKNNLQYMLKGSLGICFFVFFIGCIHERWRKRLDRKPFEAKASRWPPWSGAFLLFVVAGAFFISVEHDGFNPFYWLKREEIPLGPETHQLFWALVIVLGLLAAFIAWLQFLLPRQWRSFEQADTVLRQGQPGSAQDTKLPFLSELIGLVDWLVPKRTELPDLEKMDTDFLEQELKVVLHRFASDFGRVVILIDDVDVFPHSHFQELFRALRPLTKVSNVCCVVTVPLYFHSVLMSPKLGDLHSTVRGSIVLGNRELFEAESDVVNATTHLGMFKNREAHIQSEEFTKLLGSRLRFRLAGIDWRRQSKQVKFVQWFFHKWKWDLDKPEDSNRPEVLGDPEVQARIRHLLMWSGGSIRELLRAFDRELDSDHDLPLQPVDPSYHDPSPVIHRSEWVRMLKEEYAKGEKHLACD